MTLYEYIQTHDDEEVTIFDKDYDTETYFYKNTSDDEWDTAMVELSKLLEVTSTGNNGVCVNLSDLIERNLDKLGDLFNVLDIDVIMESIDSILAGNVSEKWLKDFVEVLK